MSEATILVVDDEEDLAYNLADFLELEGFTVCVHLSGEEALKSVESQKPDLALLDIQLTGISGLEVLQKLKEKYPLTPVVMVSASSQKGTREKVDEYGADALILKPYDQDELLNLINRLLQGRNIS
ncbi:MAG: response regulator [Candidatus Omnitrophota bacterium]